jgi:hypothetical protein
MGILSYQSSSCLTTYVLWGEASALLSCLHTWTLTLYRSSMHRGLECTGTLVGPRHVVTAAHCVFDINDSRQMVSSLDFSPGLTATARPFGIVEWSTVRILDTFTQQVSMELLTCTLYMLCGGKST